MENNKEKFLHINLDNIDDLIKNEQDPFVRNKL